MPTEEELQRIRMKALAQEAPYGLTGAPPSDEMLEYTDPQNEAAVVARWRPIIEQHGGDILGVTDIPRQPMEFVYDDITWSVRVMSSSDQQVLPQTGYNRLVAFEAEGVPFGWFLWAEEQFTRPTFIPIPDAPAETPATKQRIAPVVHVDPDRAAPKREPEWETWGQMLNRWRRDIAEARRRDPLLIGVIPTSPNRGVWVVIAKWFH